MSIHSMIAMHPEVGSDINEDLATAVSRSMCCAVICTSCADACLAEEMEMRQCIRVCLDCADICAATSRIAIRNTGSNEQILHITLLLCAEACDRCATDCLLHEPEHCHFCATICRECAADCRRAAATSL